MTTLGFLLIFFGIQLHQIDSYTLTPRASRFVAQRMNGPSEYVQDGVSNARAVAGQYANPGYNGSPFYQAAYNSGTQNTGFQNTAYRNQGVAPAVAATGPVKTIRTPEWICWPVLFFGSVLCLFSFLRR